MEVMSNLCLSGLEVLTPSPIQLKAGKPFAFQVQLTCCEAVLASLSFSATLTFPRNGTVVETPLEFNSYSFVISPVGKTAGDVVCPLVSGHGECSVVISAQFKGDS